MSKSKIEVKIVQELETLEILIHNKKEELRIARTTLISLQDQVIVLNKMIND